MKRLVFALAKIFDTPIILFKKNGNSFWHDFVSVKMVVLWAH